MHRLWSVLVGFASQFPPKYDYSIPLLSHFCHISPFLSYSLLPTPYSLLPNPYFLAATAQTALISTAVSTAYSGPGTSKPRTIAPQK